MPKGVPVGDDEIKDMRRLAEENPDWSYEQIAEELIRLGYPRRHKSVIHRYVRDIRERQAREGIEKRKADIGAEAVSREIEGLVKRFPELKPQAEKLAEIKLQTQIEKAERELWEASGEKKQMEQQIAGLSERLRVAQATIGSLKGQVRDLEPYPQKYAGERAKAEYMHNILNTCASEYYKAKGEERRAERILRRDEYEGLAPDDFKPFFAGIGRSAGEAERRLRLFDLAVKDVVDLEEKMKRLEEQVNPLEVKQKRYSEALFDLGVSLLMFFSEWDFAVNNGQLDFYVEGESEFYRLNVEGTEHVRFKAYDTLPSDGVLLRDLFRGFTLGIKKGMEERIEDELRTLETKIGEQVGRIDKLGEELEEEGGKKEG